MKKIKVVLVLFGVLIGLSSCYQEPIHDLTPEEEEEVHEIGCVTTVIPALRKDSYVPETDSLHAEFGLSLDDASELNCEGAWISLVIHLHGTCSLLDFTYPTNSGWSQPFPGDDLYQQGTIVLEKYIEDPIEVILLLDNADGDSIYIEVYANGLYKLYLNFDGN